MTNKEAIEIIKENYPRTPFSSFAKALDKAMAVLDMEGRKIGENPPPKSPKLGFKQPII